MVRITLLAAGFVIGEYFCPSNLQMLANAALMACYSSKCSCSPD